MKLPIIFIAFGTTTKAIATYQQLHAKLATLLPDRNFFWAYSSKRITADLKKEDGNIQSPEEILTMLAERGHKEVIMQSLHLFPGTEFHSLVTIARQSSLTCRIGLPLLTGPEDYNQICTLLAPQIERRPDRTILILGHGTTHPSWTGYYSLQTFMRTRFGERVHVGVVEQYPDSTNLINEIAESGCRKVTIFPFFLIAGMHYRRDIVAEDKSSWRSKLVERGIDVEVLENGIGLLPGVENILLRHITEAK
jgi:sirohydrochlorin cobaltochelatase